MTDNPYETPATVLAESNPKKRILMTFIKLLAILGIVVVLIGLFLPVNRGREAARRTQCKNNLKQIAFALFNYHEAHGALPPAYTVDSAGRPLHSWRTLILPYLDHGPLYKSIDLSKPWTDPANAEAFKMVPSVYRCPSGGLSDGYTSYLAVVGTECCLSATEPRMFSEITDGIANTLMVVEVAKEHAVPWMSPQDADEQIVLSFVKGGTLAHTGGTQAAMADGRALFLSQHADLQTLQGMLTIAGNEKPGEL